jgi:hypothetical protein
MIEFVRRRRPAWRTAALGVLTCAVLVGCAQASTPTRVPSFTPTSTVPAAAATTQLRVFTPYRHGKLTTPAGPTQRGMCWTSSITVARVGVYRCLATNQILDPCFAPPGRASARTVACFADPWSPATLLKVDRPLPRGRPLLSHATPWALQLRNGATCVSATGTVRMVGGVALNYNCARGRSAGLSSEQLGRHRVLHAQYGLAGRHDHADLRRVPVTVAWT